MFRSFMGLLAGYIAACLAAGMTQLSFVLDPAAVLASRESFLAAAVLIAMAATQSGTFALPFAVIALGVIAVSGWRGWLSFVAAGLMIGICGYWTVLAGGEPGGASNTALKAFVISGAIAGWVFWWMSQRLFAPRLY